MRPRVLVVLLGVILLVTGAAAVTGMTGASVLTPPGTEPVHSEYRTVSTDLGLVVGMGDATVRSHFEHRAIEHRIQHAENETPEAVIDEYLDQLESELEAFAEEEASLIAAFHEGEIDSDTLVRSLVRIDAEARARQATLSDLPQFDAHVPGRGLRAETTNLQQRYDMHVSQVRQQLATGYADATARPLALIETGNASLVMTSVANQQYHREAVRFDRWNRTGEDQITDLSEVELIASDAYPDAPDAMLIRRAAAGLYFVQWSTPTGSITAYVDGANEAVFLERHQHWYHLLPTAGSDTFNDSGVSISIGRTFPTGPMNVSVIDQSTGEPLDARVEIALDGTWVDVGTTDSRGIVWLIEPSGTYELRVTGEFGEITTTR